MAMTANGLTPCPGGDCHGIDHAWCAPGRHRGAPRRCTTCGRPEDNHSVRHPFTHPAYQPPRPGVRTP